MWIEVLLDLVSYVTEAITNSTVMFSDVELFCIRKKYLNIYISNSFKQLIPFPLCAGRHVNTLITLHRKKITAMIVILLPPPPPSTINKDVDQKHSRESREIRYQFYPPPFPKIILYLYEGLISWKIWALKSVV